MAKPIISRNVLQFYVDLLGKIEIMCYDRGALQNYHEKKFQPAVVARTFCLNFIGLE